MTPMAALLDRVRPWAGGISLAQSPRGGVAVQEGRESVDWPLNVSLSLGRYWHAIWNPRHHAAGRS